MLLLLLYYHSLQTVLLNIWNDDFNGWVESKLMKGKQNNCAGVAHKGQNFGHIGLMLSHHPIFFFFFNRQKKGLLFRLRLWKQGGWCGAKENAYMSVTVNKSTSVDGSIWCSYLQYPTQILPNIHTHPPYSPFRRLSFTLFHSIIYCIAVIIFIFKSF